MPMSFSIAIYVYFYFFSFKNNVKVSLKQEFASIARMLWTYCTCNVLFQIVEAALRNSEAYYQDIWIFQGERGNTSEKFVFYKIPCFRQI